MPLPCDSHRFLKSVVITVITLGLYSTSSCSEATGLNSERVRIGARVLSDSIADDIINNRRSSIYGKLERSFRESINKTDVDSMYSQIVKTYGIPTNFVFKQDELGVKTYAQGTRKPIRKFWYAARTTKFPQGGCFLIVEIVQDGDRLAVAEFSLVTFSENIPRFLK